MDKSILKSKTFWLAALQAIVGIFVVFETAYPGIGWLVIGKSVVDVILRAVTTVPVAL